MAHLGQNIAKLRGIRRLTQKEMAAKIDLAQPVYSKIERKAVIDDNLLQVIANALEVPVDAIKNFSENSAINNISCNFSDSAVNTIYQFNPLDKIIELYETVIKQKDEIIRNKEEVIEMYKNQQKAS